METKEINYIYVYTEQMNQVVNELDYNHFSIKKASQLVMELGGQGLKIPIKISEAMMRMMGRNQDSKTQMIELWLIISMHQIFENKRIDLFDGGTKGYR
ncbi:uncharacterized protein LOC115972195 isoform X2 [Quercus lobata]|uniref:uncharacterized protein LOC115972195 isoform X2 n=1 Tax=Quercus lobata TaxID=97700 RepID=UPI001244775B|nr:uncharacterized protein LOC115972195 isoform X2 [Quercus lobata]